MDAYVENADKVKHICNASTTVIQCLPDVPNHFSADRKESGESSFIQKCEVLKNRGRICTFINLLVIVL